jgi:hypothetical protein
MATWSWKDVEWGPGGIPDYIKTRMTPVGPRPKDADGKPVRDTRPKKQRFRLTTDGAKAAVERLSKGESIPDVAIDMRVPEELIHTASRRAGPHDCAYGCGPTRTVPVGPAHSEDDRIRQRVRCTCPAQKCWMRVTVKDTE